MNLRSGTRSRRTAQTQDVGTEELLAAASVPVEESLTAGLRPALPKVNLLPPEIAQARRLQLVKAGGGGAVLLAAGLVGLLTLSAASGVSAAQAELDAAQTRQAVAAKEVADLADVRGVYSEVRAREGLLTRAMGAEVRWSGTLTDLSLTQPSTVWMTGLTVDQDVDALGTGTPADGIGDPGIGSVTFTGTGRTHDDVAAFLESLSTRPGYANPYFTSAIERYVGKVPVVDFTATVSVTPDAYEGRYTDPTGDNR